MRSNTRWDAVRPDGTGIPALSGAAPGLAQITATVTNSSDRDDTGSNSTARVTRGGKDNLPALNQTSTGHRRPCCKTNRTQDTCHPGERAQPHNVKGICPISKDN